jgi:hypothetical protein
LKNDTSVFDFSASKEADRQCIIGPRNTLSGVVTGRDIEVDAMTQRPLRGTKGKGLKKVPESICEKTVIDPNQQDRETTAKWA